MALLERLLRIGRPGSVYVEDGGAWGLPHVATLPTCDASRDGEARMVRGGAGVADRVVVCEKDAADAYAWEEKGAAALAGRALAFNVKDYGAVGDGTTDDTTAIQNTISAANTAGGGTVYLPAGRYKITSTLIIGDGTEAGPSTINTIAVIGDGPGVSDALVVPHGAGTELLWYGAAAGTVIDIRGPIYGIRLEGFHIDGKPSTNAAGTLIKTTHMMHSRVALISGEQWSARALDIDAYDNPTNVVNGANECLWEELQFTHPSASAADGIRIGAALYGVSPHLDVAQNTFVNLHVDTINGVSSPTGAALVLRFCDNFSFVHCLFQGDTAIRVEPPADDTTWPKAVVFYNSPLIGGVAVSGTFTGTHGLLFWPYQTHDDPTIPAVAGAHGITSAGRIFGADLDPLTLTGLAGTGTRAVAATPSGTLEAGDPVITTHAISIPIGDGLSALPTGVYLDISMPCAGTWAKWRIEGTKFTSGSTGSLVADLWKVDYAGFPATVANTITAAAKPTMTTAAKAESSTLTGWTTTFAAGDTVRLNIDSAATVSLATLTLEYLPSLVARQAIVIPVGDSTAVPGTGIWRDFSMPTAGTWKKWRILGTVFSSGSTGSLVVDIWKELYSAFPATVADTITAAAKPTLTTAASAESSTLTGWTTAFAAGDTFRVNIDSVALLTLGTLILEYDRTV